jgi:hypothetical protein
MTDTQRVIAAFADGERVDADALDGALADAGGRGYLIDVLVLRGLVNGHGVDPVVVGASRADRAEGTRHGAVRTAWLSAAAAALMVASLGSGFAAGWRVAGGGTAPDGQQVVDVPSLVLPSTTLEAPAPTRVIRFEPGVDWQESVGGNLS